MVVETYPNYKLISISHVIDFGKYVKYSLVCIEILNTQIEKTLLNQLIEGVVLLADICLFMTVFSSETLFGYNDIK